MNTRLIVDKQEGLKELKPIGLFPQPEPIRWVARFFSYLFHPVFIPVYVVFFLVYIHPYYFVGYSSFDKLRVAMMSLVMYGLFPVVTVLLLKALDFISSIQLHTQKDRIIPLIACGIWYGWICYIWWNNHKLHDGLSVPKDAVRFTLAVFIASWFALMINIKIKISLHAIATGVMLTFMIFIGLTQALNFGAYISMALLITGIVCTSRFIVSDHTPLEVYGGLLAGAVAMLIAYAVT